ncbi:MAG TPA: hypothetical protein VGW78_00790 [Candidatus Babeliales bacterium]|jgi:hypothetical protein|nr:hypothetical protein [Candidatus Babeliales bacterium]
MKYVYLGFFILSIISATGYAETRKQYGLNPDKIFTKKGFSIIPLSAGAGASVGAIVGEHICAKDNVTCKLILAGLGGGVGCLASMVGVGLDSYTIEEPLVDIKCHEQGESQNKNTHINN